MDFHAMVIERMQKAGLSPIGDGVQGEGAYVMPFRDPVRFKSEIAKSGDYGVVDVVASAMELRACGHDEEAIGRLADARCDNAIAVYRQNSVG